ncbi:glutamyl-tRNA reductase [Clostridium culturomicium]|uniref:glutamyl-tRNA reductase n=1 Tax=Clostridium culturomicium TaxID=1499683 RepID=UPI0009DDBF4F|nr:glutamyl-tRNA reductase [Clostridium culturomicium]
MNIIMVSVDHKSADIESREKFSFTASGVKEALINIKSNPLVEGAVLICTCNRTELYLSCNEGDEVDAVGLLCKETKVNPKEMEQIFRVKHNEQAINHLMEVACGLRSMILCEDQIITQVKNAAAVAREVKTIDSILETLFRLAATCAKKAKTNIKVRAVPTSVAGQAVCMLEDKYGLKDKDVLVIGNGEMGRICSTMLVEKGANVTITLRTYKHGMTVVPRGCDTIAYDKREEFLPQVEMVISATASPHYTITKDMVEDRKVELKLVDLALPRDIDPAIKNTELIQCFNIDSLAKPEELENGDAIEKIRNIIEEYKEEYYRWYKNHLCQDQIKAIKKVVAKRVSGGLDIDYGDEVYGSIIEKAVYKTVDICLRSMSEDLSPEFLESIQFHVNKK